MQKIKAFLSSVPKWQLFLSAGGVLIIIALGIIFLPNLRRSAVIKLGSISGLTITADKQDSLGIFSDSRFTLKSDTDLSVKAIKDNLKTEPDTSVEIVEVSPRQYQIIPKETLKPGEIIKLKLLTGDREYSWAFETKNNFRVVRTLPANKTTSVPINTGIEITFSHDSFDNIDNLFSISPNVEGKFERHQRTVSFVPKDLAPSTLYTVTLKKGLKLNGSTDTLSEPTTFQFETASSGAADQNRLNFVKLAYEFSTKETPAIDLYANNIDSLSNVNVTVYKYATVNKFSEDYQNKLTIPRWANNFYDNYVTSNNGLTKTLEFTAPVQKANYSGYFLFPQSMPKGFYLIEATSGTQKSQAFVQITDLSAYFTVSGSQTMAWVNRVDTNTPVQSAKISVLGQTYSTDKDGVSIFTSPASLITDPIKLITINDSQDSLLIPAADRTVYYSNSEYEATRRVSNKYWSYLYLDRPIYQPTDKVRFWGLLRDRDDLNKSQKITISLTGGYQDYYFDTITLYEKDYQTSNIGTFIGEVPLPKLNAGFYTLNIKVGSDTIISSGLTVENYTKPAYQLTLNSAKNAVIAGEPIDLSGKAAFFEGTPLSNLKLKISGQSQQDVVTDAQGSFKITENPNPNPDGESYQPQYKNFSVNPASPEEGDINAGTSVAIFNSSIYLSAKTTNTADQAKVTLSLNQIDLTKFVPYQYGSDVSFIGAPVQSHQITGELIENTWVKKEVGTYYDFINKVTSPRYEYSQVTNKLGDVNLTTDAQGQAVYEFPTTKDKYYQLILKSVDSANRVATNSVYIYGTDLYSSSSDTRLLLSEDKVVSAGTYLIDEPVSLTPVQGTAPITSGKMLYIFAQRGIKNYAIADTNKYTFNFKESFVPDIYVQGIRFTGTTYQLSESKLLNFDTSSKLISLAMKLDKLSYLPGDKAHLTVSTKDQKGNPIASEVNINLVDEAIFQISPVTTNPLSGIYKNVDSDIISYYLSHQYPIEANPSERGGCFLPGTKVILANGSSKNIEEIKVGDMVKTRESIGNSLLVDAKVTQVMNHQVGQYLLINHHLRVTPEHNLYINGRWITAESVKVGDSYLDINNHYQSITSIESYIGKYSVYNLSIDKYHTYFADGFYVHNEKGRDLFVDTAYFGNVQTGANGEASLDITLPDNLTSWRITSQSLTQDLKAGVSTEKLVVKQPFFIDLVLGQDYLVADKPVLTLRGFGEQLNQSDTVNFHVSIPTLLFEKDLTAKAFESVGIPFPDLSVGTHSVIVTATAGQLKDKLTRTFNVLSSRLQISKSDYQNLALDTKITGDPAGQTQLVFSDQSAGRFFSTLNTLSFNSGDRLDQKLGRIVSQELINKYFDSSVIPEKFTASVYSTEDGGFALLPYSSSDLPLAVEVACLAPSKIDTSSLVNYFYKNLTDAKETLSASQSLAGLACLNQPVLVVVNKFLSLPDIDSESLVYLSLAQAGLGDTEKSTTTVKTLLSNYSSSQDNQTYVKIGKTKDDYLTNTSLLAAVMATDGIPEADQLYNYVNTNNAKDVLLTANQLIYINQKLSTGKSSPVKFAYILDGKKVTKELKQGEAFKLSVSPEQLINIKFEDIAGNVGVVSTYETSTISNQTSKDLTLNRSYGVAGKTTTEFVSSDLVKISLDYTIKPNSQDGCYQVNDYLPSGLKVITRLFERNLQIQDISYPYAIDGQKVSFCVYKDSQKPINYYARIVSPGIFKAESGLMQSMISPSIFTLSNSSSVTIK